MEIRRIPVKQINIAPYNPRKDLKPGDVEYENLKQSISEFGFVEPLVWNEATGNLVGGHQRLKILKELGATEVEVSVVNLTPEREKALNVALNKIQGSWDDNKLGELLGELQEKGIAELTGFSEEEVNSIVEGITRENIDVDFSLYEGKGEEQTDEQTIQCPKCGFKFAIKSR